MISTSQLSSASSFKPRNPILLPSLSAPDYRDTSSQPPLIEPHLAHVFSFTISRPSKLSTTMDTPCFASPFTTIAPSPFQGTALSSRQSNRVQTPNNTVRAELNDLIPGVPPGEDVRDNAPLRYYVPRPAENYDDRGFATILPRTWEGEIETIGVTDIAPVTKEDVEQSRIVPVDPASSGAFVDYSQMVKAERKAALEELKTRSALGKTGRATCGEEEGKAFVSNYRPILVDGVKAVEYWGVPNGAVPRLFGGSGA